MRKTLGLDSMNNKVPPKELCAQNTCSEYGEATPHLPSICTFPFDHREDISTATVDERFLISARAVNPRPKGAPFFDAAVSRAYDGNELENRISVRKGSSFGWSTTRAHRSRQYSLLLCALPDKQRRDRSGRGGQTSKLIPALPW